MFASKVDERKRKSPPVSRGLLRGLVRSLTRFRDTEFGVVKLVDGRAIGAYYSTTAKQVQIDFTGGVRF